ncbi:predicted protein [Plenodomus lingam JN3]|uniref:Predicted protein n=1 Tax=Leptosphaeria maculans (strain JN3 / isolate v23.1.3 / race Av1-4-5-6-7-8) TaxID=985895 RepID=E5A8I7_LEPMJ|nr:predicted protein [Plenodomus lingam JN3]CBX99932.1 predicted protein [Plenodomus lingam JN3]
MLAGGPSRQESEKCRRSGSAVERYIEIQQYYGKPVPRWAGSNSYIASLIR